MALDGRLHVAEIVFFTPICRSNTIPVSFLSGGCCVHVRERLRAGRNVGVNGSRFGVGLVMLRVWVGDA